MATYQAIAACCEAVLQVLRTDYAPGQFGPVELDFKVYAAKDFTSPMQTGVSLFLYRVALNDGSRVPTRGGTSQRLPRPLDLHMMLTAWGRDASLQHAIAGWMISRLEATPLLPSSLLNSVWPGVFQPNEALEVVLSDLATQELYSLWERLTERGYSLSVPYVVRPVWLDLGAGGTTPPLVGQPRSAGR